MKEKTFYIYELFGLKKGKGERVEKDFKHALIEAKDMEHLAESLEIQNGGELALKVFLYANELKKNQDLNMVKGILGIFRQEEE